MSFTDKELDLFYELLEQEPLLIIKEVSYIYAVFTLDKKPNHQAFLNCPNVELVYVGPQGNCQRFRQQNSLPKGY